jgi:hypothetical protein
MKDPFEPDWPELLVFVSAILLVASAGVFFVAAMLL